MLKVCLDINCIIDIEEGRPGAASVQKILDALDIGLLSVGVAVIHAAERQPNALPPLDNASPHLARVERINKSISHLSALFILDYAWFDYARIAPKKPYSPLDKISTLLWGLNFEDLTKKFTGNKLRNRICDTLAFEAAIHHDHIFVSNNEDDFRKLTKDSEFKNKFFTPLEFVNAYLS